MDVGDLIFLERYQWLCKLKFANEEPPQDTRQSPKLYQLILKNFISDWEWLKVWKVSWDASTNK